MSNPNPNVSFFGQQPPGQSPFGSILQSPAQSQPNSFGMSLGQFGGTPSGAAVNQPKPAAPITFGGSISNPFDVKPASATGGFFSNPNSAAGAVTPFGQTNVASPFSTQPAATTQQPSGWPSLTSSTASTAQSVSTPFLSTAGSSFQVPSFGSTSNAFQSPSTTNAFQPPVTTSFQPSSQFQSPAAPFQSSTQFQSNLFGSSMAAAAPAFGASTQSSLFSATSIPSLSKGTGNPAFTVTPDVEMDKTIYLNTISAMPAYKTKSFEELRLEDYQRNNRFPGFPTSTAVTASQPFGTAPSPFSGTSPFQPQPAPTTPAPPLFDFGKSQPSAFTFGKPADPAPFSFDSGKLIQPATATPFGGNPFQANANTPAPFQAPQPAPPITSQAPPFSFQFQQPPASQPSFFPTPTVNPFSTINSTANTAGPGSLLPSTIAPFSSQLHQPSLNSSLVATVAEHPYGNNPLLTSPLIANPPVIGKPLEVSKNVAPPPIQSTPITKVRPIFIPKSIVRFSDTIRSPKEEKKEFAFGFISSALALSSSHPKSFSIEKADIGGISIPESEFITASSGIKNLVPEDRETFEEFGSESAPMDSEEHALDGQYYSRPPLSILRKKLPSSDPLIVRGFRVGRRGVGFVDFLEPIDLRQIDLDRIFGDLITLTSKQITVYPNELEKPSVGTGLNVPARVTLYCCWPIDRKTGRVKIGSDIDQAALKMHMQKLASVSDTEFIDFDSYNGAWIFRVGHFSTYTCKDASELIGRDCQLADAGLFLGRSFRGSFLGNQILFVKRLAWNQFTFKLHPCSRNIGHTPVDQIFVDILNALKAGNFSQLLQVIQKNVSLLFAGTHLSLVQNLQLGRYPEAMSQSVDQPLIASVIAQAPLSEETKSLCRAGALSNPVLSILCGVCERLESYDPVCWIAYCIGQSISNRASTPQKIANEWGQVSGKTSLVGCPVAYCRLVQALDAILLMRYQALSDADLALLHSVGFGEFLVPVVNFLTLSSAPQSPIAYQLAASLLLRFPMCDRWIFPLLGDLEVSPSLERAFRLGYNHLHFEQYQEFLKLERLPDAFKVLIERILPVYVLGLQFSEAELHFKIIAEPLLLKLGCDFTLAAEYHALAAICGTFGSVLKESDAPILVRFVDRLLYQLQMSDFFSEKVELSLALISLLEYAVTGCETSFLGEIFISSRVTKIANEILFSRQLLQR